jgi:hypothetical protein
MVEGVAQALKMLLSAPRQFIESIYTAPLEIGATVKGIEMAADLPGEDSDLACATNAR